MCKRTGGKALEMGEGVGSSVVLHRLALIELAKVGSEACPASCGGGCSPRGSAEWFGSDAKVGSANCLERLARVGAEEIPEFHATRFA